LTGSEWLSVTQLKWRRFTGFLPLREAFRDQPCIYLQTDPHERILRVGESKDLWGSRYRGGTAYALEAALHGSGNLFFAAPAPIDEAERKSLEATLIYDLQPTYNNDHKKYPPFRRMEYAHGGEVPSTLRSSV
jgi:excinuclease UvrABC nuclease subunit